MGYQQKLGEVSSKHKIKMVGVSGYVEAPLPEDFGFTVGNVYSTPFDAGAINGLSAKAAYTGGIGLSPTISMKKVFMSPEPTEISFEMEFAAYYSTKTEVLSPILRLLEMSLSSQLTTQKTADKIQTIINKISGMSNTAVGTALSTNDSTVSTSVDESETVKRAGDAALGLIGFIQAPSTVTLMFGDFMHMTNVFVSNVGVKFSNKLDVDGIPMSASCSVSVVLERPPTIEDVADNWFGGVSDLL